MVKNVVVVVEASIDLVDGRGEGSSLQSRERTRLDPEDLPHTGKKISLQRACVGS